MSFKVEHDVKINKWRESEWDPELFQVPHKIGAAKVVY